MSSLEMRIASLEKKLIRQRRFLILLGGLLIASIWIAADEQTDGPFVVRDSQGRMKAHLGLNQDSWETAGLWFFDSQGNRRLYLGMNRSDEPGIYFYIITFNELRQQHQGYFYLSD